MCAAGEICLLLSIIGIMLLEHAGGLSVVLTHGCTCIRKYMYGLCHTYVYLYQ
jgi:hypothetical protein